MDGQSQHLDALDALIEDRAVNPQTWAQPDQFDLSSWADRQEVARRIEDGQIAATIDRGREIADDLFEMRFPHLAGDVQAKQEYVAETTAQGSAYGQWFHFGWKNTLERYPDHQDHQDLRTFRNKNLITHNEQQRLLDAKVAVFGLSVGSNVVEQLNTGGIGGTMVMGDFDTLSPTNLNRIRSTMAQVGMSKLDIAACKISEVDPYIQQIHFKEGVNGGVLDKLTDIHPDIIFDEVDDLAAKVMLRRFARDQKLPLVMATDLGDVSILDVERHDLGDATIFGGRIKERELDQISNQSLSAQQRQKIMMKIVGLRYITPRLLQSAMEVNKTVGGLPQLGTTAATGGALAAVAAREILVGRTMKSGRYVSSSKRLLKLQHHTSLSDSIQTIGTFIKSRK